MSVLYPRVQIPSSDTLEGGGPLFDRTLQIPAARLNLTRYLLLFRITLSHFDFSLATLRPQLRKYN
ncbi:MAG: hypothetical protein IPP66_20610 [Anaerolineales bacterium]|nr:hypothetical protein [Anaerolineales bacterium]